MSIKNIIEIIILFSLLIFISPKEEKPEKFLSSSFFEGPKEIKSFATSSDHKIINTKCLYSHEYNIYSLQGLQNDKEDYEYVEEDNKTKIYYNFCRNTHAIENSTFVEDNNGTLVRLSGSIEGEGESKNVWEESKEGGVLISLVEGEICNNSEKYSVSLDIRCDADKDGKKFKETIEVTKADSCKYNVLMKSLYGCSLKSKYLLLKLFQKFKFPFAIIFVLFGVGLCFFGNRFIKYAIIGICGLVGCYALTALVLRLFPNFITKETYLFICLILCFVLGCVIGYFIRNDEKMYILLLGAGLGYFAATFVYQIIQNYVEFDPEILYYACVGVCIVIGAFLAWKLTKYIIILATSVFGGYLMMRGVSLIAGNYLDEGLVIDLIKSKEWDELKEMRNGWTYAYLGSWIVLTVAGVYLQCTNNKKKKSKDVEKDKK